GFAQPADQRNVASRLADLDPGGAHGSRRGLSPLLVAPRVPRERHAVAASLRSSFRRAAVLAQYRPFPPNREGAADVARQPAVLAPAGGPESARAVLRRIC